MTLTTSTNSQGNSEIDLPANFKIDYENYHLTDDEYISQSDKNLILTVTIGDKKVFENTEIEADNQNTMHRIHRFKK